MDGFLSNISKIFFNKNKTLIKFLKEENEKIKSKLNFYVNFYLEDKARWKVALELLSRFNSDIKLDDFCFELINSIAKCINNNNIYLILYQECENNKIFTPKLKLKTELYLQKYFEKMTFDEAKVRISEIFSVKYEILPICFGNKEYGYLFIEKAVDTKVDEDNYFIKTLSEYVSLAIEHNENRQSLKFDNKNKVEFLVNFSHELKTPLNGIITYSELLKSEKDNNEHLGENFKKYIQNINISARQLNYLMIDIAESAKTQYSQLKVVKEKFLTNLEILNILSVFHSKIIEKNLTVERILTDVEIYSDITKFNQILYNLISNAIKFSSENGKVTLSSWVENGNFNFEIEDEGDGIKEHEENKIFKFLSQGNLGAQKQGSGVGLAISKRIVEIQGGKIGYSSKEAGGTIFYFCLPLDDGL